MFLRDIPEGHLSIEKADNKPGSFPSELKNIEKSIKTFEKSLHQIPYMKSGTLIAWWIILFITYTRPFWIYLKKHG